MSCPKCKTDHSQRSHRRGLFEHGVSILGYYPYCCRKCGCRFLRLRNAPMEDAATSNSPVNREIKATRSAMRAQRKVQEILLYSAAMALFMAILYYLTMDRSGSIEGGYAAPPPSPDAIHSVPVAS